MSRTSHAHLLATLTLSAAFIACTAAAMPLHRVQYEVYNDQQTAPRDGQPASDLQIVASEQTPSELQSHSGQQQGDQAQVNEQPSSSEQKSEQAASPPPSNEQPASSEQKGEQAAAPPPASEQPNAFVSEKSNEPQDVAQTEPQSSEQPRAQGEQEQKSSEPSQGQPAPSTETTSGEDNEPQ